MSDDKEYLKTNNPSEETDEKENKDQYEKICFMCRRPESKAGKMIDLPMIFIFVQIVCREALIP